MTAVSSKEVSPLSQNTTAESEDGEQRVRTISRGVRSLTVQNIGTSILGLIFVSTLVRYLPGAQYGIYSAISIIVNIGAAFANFGFQYASARYVSIAGGNRVLLASAVKKIILLTILFSTIITTLLVVFSSSESLFFAKSTSWSFDFDLGALWLFSSSMSSILQGFVQGLKRYSLLSLILFVTRVVMVALTIFGLVFDADLSVAVYAWIIYGALITLWSLDVVRRELRDAGRPDVQGESSQRGFEYRDVLRYSFPLAIAGILIVATQNSDLVVVGGYLDPISLGIYNAVITILTFLTYILLTPLVTAILPEASSSSKSFEKISNGLRLSLRFVFLGILPASLCLAAMSPQLLLIFSGRSSYLAGSLSLELIAAFYPLLAVQTVIYSIQQGIGRTFHVLLVILAATACEIVGSILLVPQLGLLGAAIGRVLSFFAGMGVSIYLAKGLLVKRESKGFYWKAVFSALVPFLAVLYLSNFVSHNVWTLVPYSLFASTLFLLCVRTLKILNDEDRAMLTHILPSERLRKLLNYV